MKILGIGLLTFALLGSRSAGANGGAYNGPDFEGISIPVSIDRIIKIDDINRTLRRCFEEQTLDLTSLIYPGLQFKATSSHNDFGVTAGGNFDGGVHASTESNPYKSFSTNFSNSTYSAGRVWIHIEKWLILLPYDPKGKPQRLPAFIYDEEIPDTAYDELGQVIPGKVILKNLRISLPENYGPAVKLFNSETGKPTSLFINEEKLVACYVSELQREQ